MHMFMRPFHTICPSLPHKRQCILLHVEHRFPILCRVRASYIPIWYYIYDAWQGSQFSPSPLQHSMTNQSCPKVTPVTTGIIIHFSFSAAASLYSSPCLHEICLYPAEWEYSYQVHTEPFSEWWCLEWVSNLWTFSPSRKLTRMCAHIHATCWSCLLFYCQYQSAQGLYGLTAVDRGWIVEVRMMAALAEIE